MSDDMRFSGLTGTEYKLVIEAHPHFPDLQGVVAQRIAECTIVAPDKPLQVLELGCGDGYTTSILLMCGKSMNLVALDNEPTMLADAALNLSGFMSHDRSHQSLSLIEADALEYLEQQAENTYHAVVSAMTFHNWYSDYRNCVIRQIFKVLQPQGIFVNADKYYIDSRRHNRELQSRFDQYFSVFRRLDRPDLLQEWIMHELEDANPDRIMSAPASLSFLSRIGFRNIELSHTMALESVLAACK